MSTNPKDPQAELRGVLEQFVSELIYNTEHKTGVDPYPRLDEILNIFQAHQQELLSELLGELPKANSIVQPDLSVIPDTAHWIYFKGQLYMKDQVILAIEKYREEL